MGRKPKPTKIKILEGNPGKKPLNKNEPEFNASRPTCPKWLTSAAKTEWKRIVPELERVGLLSMVDRAALVGYCESWAKYKEAEELLNKEGNVFEMHKINKDGEIISTYYLPRPEVAISNQALDKILKCCAEFGLTPSSRSRMSVPGQKKNEEIEGLLD